MYNFLKSILNYFYFTPKYLNFLKTLNLREKKIMRPYFGIYFKNSGGPAIRTKRLIKHFGNHLIDPNIIYAQSFWSEKELKDAITYSKKKKVPIIFNQNGLYYNAWFDGNYKKKNKLISLTQKKSKYIFFQSNFCKSSSIFFTKFKPKKYKILYNSIPKTTLKYKKKMNPQIFNIILSGYFNKKNLYILEPAINVIFKLAKKIKKCPRLVIYGLNKDHLNDKLNKKIEYLLYKDKIMIYKNYNINNISYVLKNIHISLHLKYKDPCPNAVLERMQHGIPHIISDSGGTPELTGNSSINIKVKDTWETLVKVDEKKLYDAIIVSIKKYNFLKKNTYKQIKKFSWKKYLFEHKQIFLKNVSN